MVLWWWRRRSWWMNMCIVMKLVLMFSLALRVVQRHTPGFTGTAGTMSSQVSHNLTITNHIKFKAWFITGGSWDLTIGKRCEKNQKTQKDQLLKGHILYQIEYGVMSLSRLGIINQSPFSSKSKYSHLVIKRLQYIFDQQTWWTWAKPTWWWRR